MDERKIVIVGSGQVGSTFAYALMMNGLASTIVLTDARRETAEGNVMDLNHGLLFVPPVNIYAGDYSDCKDAEIVVVTAGASQKPGETRLELVQRNVEIFRDIIPKIAREDPKIILIVSNPVDILTYAALKISGYPSNRVIGSGTVLDTARFRYLLSKKCRVDPRNVHAYIIGEHGDSEVPVWSVASIGGVPFENYCPICEKNCTPLDKEAVFNSVRNAAYEIIKRKGWTNYGVGLSLVRIVESIIRNENSILTVSNLLNDYHSISDICLSIPVLLNRDGVSRTIRFDLNNEEKEKLIKSAGILKDIVKTVGL
jgi:L-lactate dehydrogenase